MTAVLTQCIDELRRYYALPPYNSLSNTSAGDGYVLSDINLKYDKHTREEAMKVLSRELGVEQFFK